MHKLLIADGSEALRILLQEALQERYEVTVCGDGEAALNFLQTRQFDALILDISLPMLSGLSVLEEAPQVPPVVLCTALVVPTYTAQAAAELGVGFIALKPCPVRAIVNRLNDMIEKWENPSSSLLDLQAAITAHLHRLGLDTSHDGGMYLRIGIPLFAQAPNQRLGKELFMAIAERTGSSVEQIEFEIRKTIKDAWKKRDEDFWAEYFPPSPRGPEECPKAKKFIARMAEVLMNGLQQENAAQIF